MKAPKVARPTPFRYTAATYLAARDVARRAAADLPADDAVVSMAAFYGTFLQVYVEPAENVFADLQNKRAAAWLRTALALLRHCRYCIAKEYPGSELGTDLDAHIEALAGVVRRRQAFARLVRQDDF